VSDEHQTARAFEPSGVASPRPADRQLPAKRFTQTTRRGTVFTTAPDLPPPKLACPVCDVILIYKETVIGGVKPVERWHYFICRACGSFVYRDRTRKLRRTLAHGAPAELP
jgi:hypothetical protein